MGLRKQSKAGFNNISMLLFNKPILLACMWTRKAMSDAEKREELGEIPKLVSPVGLDRL